MFLKLWFPIIHVQIADFDPRQPGPQQEEPRRTSNSCIGMDLVRFLTVRVDKDGPG